MQDGRFEWDDRKAAANIRKHRVHFEDACLVFEDRFALEDSDDVSDEERWIMIGLSGVDLLVVVYTERGSRKRIISARNADANEARRYAENRGRANYD